MAHVWRWRVEDNLESWCSPSTIWSPKIPLGFSVTPSHLAGPSILVSEMGPLKAPEHVPSAKVPTQ